MVQGHLLLDLMLRLSSRDAAAGVEMNLLMIRLRPQKIVVAGVEGERKT
jgi:hypothetical protein